MPMIICLIVTEAGISGQITSWFKSILSPFDDHLCLPASMPNLEGTHKLAVTLSTFQVFHAGRRQDLKLADTVDWAVDFIQFSEEDGGCVGEVYGSSSSTLIRPLYSRSRP